MFENYENYCKIILLPAFIGENLRSCFASTPERTGSSRKKLFATSDALFEFSGTSPGVSWGALANMVKTA